MHIVFHIVFHKKAKSISLNKEADEIEYWIILCEMSRNYPNNEILKEKLKSIISILSKIISTSKSN